MQPRVTPTPELHIAPDLPEKDDAPMCFSPPYVPPSEALLEDPTDVLVPATALVECENCVPEAVLEAVIETSEDSPRDSTDQLSETASNKSTEDASVKQDTVVLTNDHIEDPVQAVVEAAAAAAQEEDESFVEPEQAPLTPRSHTPEDVEDPHTPETHDNIVALLATNDDVFDQEEHESASENHVEEIVISENDKETSS